MSFISHAQNYEDVILYRVFKNIKNGSYVDVGAHDPEVDSVTKLFYDSGWRGINIEPVTSGYEKLCECRPEDTNLRMAVGNEDGETKFYEVVGTGLSTVDKSIAERHARDHGYEVASYDVPKAKLSTILKEHESWEIHFLKIDVEGAERQVLEGIDLQKSRPWIIVVESTIPNLPEQSYEAWEPLLLAAEYEFAYFDGLNRFYVANEHRDLKSKLAIPPNVFDDFNLSGKGNSPLHYQLSAIQSSLRSAVRESETLKEANEQAKAQQRELKIQIDNGLKKQIEDNKALIEAHDQIIARQKELEIQIDKNRALKEANEQLSARNKELELQKEELAQKDQEVAELEKTRESLNRQIHDAKSKIDAMNMEIGSRYGEIAELSDSRKRLSVQVDEFARRNSAMEVELNELRTEVARRNRELHDVRTNFAAAIETAQNQIKAVYASKSWKMTKPLRAAFDIITKMAGPLKNKTVAAVNDADNALETAKDKSSEEFDEPKQTTQTRGLVIYRDKSRLSDVEADRLVKKVYREIERRDRS